MKNARKSFRTAGEEVGACGGLFGTDPNHTSRAFVQIAGDKPLGLFNEIAAAAVVGGIAERLQGVSPENVYINARVGAEMKGLDQFKHEPTRGVINKRFDAPGKHL